MTAYSIMMPFAPQRPEQLLPFAALTQWSASCLWQGQGNVGDTHVSFAHAAASGFRVPMGTSVNLMPFLHPYDAALRAQTLAATTGHRFVAGFGPGAAALQRGVLGAPYRSQLGAVREYATIVRSLLERGEVHLEGEYFHCGMQLARYPRPVVEIGLGVLRPRMAELAGEVADVAITWLTPAAYLRDTVLPALRRGAERAGRPTPRLVAVVPMALRQADRDPVALALASNSGHMRLPHYRDMLQRSGISVDVAADAQASGRALIDGGAFLYGDPAELALGIKEFVAAGVDEVVLNMSGVCATYGSRRTLGELETVLGETAP
ncbi:alkanesulfonate monooxygenase SsuD/methylene tetrahydromethanopterin reductase-like flavin-dependent oxidoreductase (luciferase family) [Micromonospora luteifusca]|uniref:Alkanesulfonate monooxygenase SsuD/methylene tetrahydromethanopterin reductase-like flavin-dependent oxidoreductase (Luciferase family) n=1 Tax=Micromonospora luteifusca TaxID=709860 RepID=A0ABS2M399_9ACTN|nr:LLM class flavin-dependent oxidoreductase [Micromonospora luteifusca]MBM7494856.1 alkanesulfonate monooxygenase SsuD/methylene tetrahydromethanopterin reductase-like flavin-dependent oxidoreductase (luciferase family) [Micromonospora luteifusca]